MADLVKRIYGGFRGVDFRGEECNLMRSPDALNVWKDYKEIDSIRTRPTMKAVAELDKLNLNYALENFHVSPLYEYGGEKVVYVFLDTQCWRYNIKDGTRTSVTGLSIAPNVSFVFNDILYLWRSYGSMCSFMQIDKAGEFKSVISETAYVPTTSIGRKPSGGGTVHEDVNLLSPYRINTFVADGESTEYYLDAQEVTILDVLVNGVEVERNSITLDGEKGLVTFKTAPSKPLTDGQDNVSIKYQKVVSGYSDKVCGCTQVQIFDNRVFASGNPNYPNTVIHCALNDATYWSDLDYYNEGNDGGAVKSLVAGNNALWVFKEPASTNSTVFYHVPTIDSEYGKIYPSTHSSISIGCVGKAINFNDDIVFFSSRGMEGINGDITTEQAVAHRSSLVDRKLLSEEDYKNMYLAEWNGYLMVFIGDKVYLADSRAKFTNEDHYEYEWFYWELKQAYNYQLEDYDTEIKFVIAGQPIVDGNDLYIPVEQYYLNPAGYWVMHGRRLCKFEYDVENVESYWVTPKDKFKNPQMQKTSNKRGCVVEATGDVSVYAKTEKTDFELIGEYENVTDYFVSRIKRKKFKDIQLKFHSKTSFSLETATLECFIGGYLKR